MDIPDKNIRVSLQVVFTGLGDYKIECYTNERCDTLLSGDKRVFLLWMKIVDGCHARGLIIPWIGKDLISVDE